MQEIINYHKVVGKRNRWPKKTTTKGVRETSRIKQI